MGGGNTESGNTRRENGFTYIPHDQAPNTCVAIVLALELGTRSDPGLEKHEDGRSPPCR